MKIKKADILFAGAIGMIVIIFMILISFNVIGYGAKQRCVLAQEKYGIEDCTQALIVYLDDETNSFESRNGAIWALGQMGDEEAIAALESYIGVDENTKLNEGISQYELQKAIKLINGFNTTAFFWR